MDKWLLEREGGFKNQTQEFFLNTDSNERVEQKAKYVLLVDDDELVLKTLAKFLKIYGYDVESTENGEEALRKVEELNLDLVIADVRMPGIDGIETIKRIRQIHQRKNAPRVPEIIITGYMDTQAQREAERLGIADYIYKPFIISEFLKTIKKKLDLGSA